MAIGIELKIKIIIMKKYSLIVTCLGLFIAGCSKNDDTMTTGRGSSSTSQYGSGSSGSKDTSITDTNINSSSRRARSGSLPSDVTTGIDTNANTLSTPSTPESSSPPTTRPKQILPANERYVQVISDRRGRRIRRGEFLEYSPHALRKRLNRC